MLQRSNQAHSFLYKASSRGSWGRSLCTATQRFKQEGKKKTMHLHKRLWGVSFSIQLEREWTSMRAHTHTFLIILMLRAASHYFCYQSPTACISRLWSTKSKVMKPPLIKKAWLILSNTTQQLLWIWSLVSPGSYSFRRRRGKNNP